MALGWSGATRGLGSQVRNAKRARPSLQRQMPAKAQHSSPSTVNHQLAGRPVSGSLPGRGSAKLVTGTRQRCAGLAIELRQNGLARLRTLVTAFLTGLPLLPGRVRTIPQAMHSSRRSPASLRTTTASYFG